ncbi:ABC transporter substrate-binding protein [Phyllobacterium lublinensis]|uniref:ABC transporter substrate-binding protein n=1 Tax=Phyllobacterium lublinensis TaxID=2875708 RepID=UPI001CCCFB86|nr:ABC transporter substrate-binding protein [Phyllobacterium sp. 2063]MBZ9653178.1 transporter substrate-binding protein [Phyllobacterium sp. 2063]
MTVDRRTFVKGCAGVLATPYLVKNAFAEETIKVASIHDASGVLDILGKPMAAMTQMAIDEINAGGGLLGKKIELKSYDTQSNNQLYGQYATEAATRYKVAAVFGAVTSASREIVRPILRRYKTLYFYSTQYEGGVCDRNIFCLGTTPGQKTEKIIPYAMNKFGKRVYTVAADYNFGHIVSKWHEKVVTENGGTFEGVEFFPLEQTDFGPTLKKIQSIQPDFVMADLVGSNHIGFFRQWVSSGMADRIGLASTIFGTGNEQLFTNPREHNGILTSACYFPEIDTPENKDFIARAAKATGSDRSPINELPAMSYYAPQLWAEAVRSAGSFDRDAVTKALEGNLTYKGPGGPITVDAESHHVTHDIYIAEAWDHGFKILERYENLPPSDTAAVCDLAANPSDTKQYVLGN